MNNKEQLQNPKEKRRTPDNKKHAWEKLIDALK